VPIKKEQGKHQILVYEFILKQSFLLKPYFCPPGRIRSGWSCWELIWSFNIPFGGEIRNDLISVLNRKTLLQMSSILPHFTVVANPNLKLFHSNMSPSMLISHAVWPLVFLGVISCLRYVTSHPSRLVITKMTKICLVYCIDHPTMVFGTEESYGSWKEAQNLWEAKGYLNR